MSMRTAIPGWSQGKPSPNTVRKTAKAESSGSMAQLISRVLVRASP
jgi:hypothetical protein